MTIDNACLGVTTSPAAELQAAFVSLAEPDLVPPDPDVPRAVARNTGTYRYVVIVPKLTAGTYDIRLECLPGDWRTNTAEGGAVILTVRPVLPATSTADSALDRTRPAGESDRPFLVGLVFVVGFAAFRWSAAGRRPGTGRARTS